MPSRELMDVSLGKRKADVVIKNGDFVNVFTKEIYAADVAVSKDRIARR